MMENIEYNVGSVGKFRSGRGQNFLESITGIVNLKGLRRDDAKRIDLLRLHLEGPALSWFRCLPEGEKDTWPHLQEAFEEKYCGDLNMEEAMALENTFVALRLGQNEDIDDFQARVLETGTILDKSEEEMLGRFTNGLPSQLAFFVRARRPESLEEALQGAKIGIANGYKGGNGQINHATFSQGTELNTLAETMKELSLALRASRDVQPPRFPAHQYMNQHVTQQPPPLMSRNVTYQQFPPHEMNYMPMPNQQVTQQNVPLQPPPQQQTYQQFPPQEMNYMPMLNQHVTQQNIAQQPPPQQQNICRLCEGQGHSTQCCNKPRNAALRPHFLCKFCGQYGHSMSFCVGQNTGN